MICAFPAITQEPPPAFELRIKGSDVAKQVERALQGTKLTIGSDRREPGGKLLFGGELALGERRTPFSVPSFAMRLGPAGQIVYRPHDIRLRGLSVTATDLEYVLVLEFHRDGTELKGIHSSLGDGIVPDVQMDHMRLRVRMRPGLDSKGRPTLERPIAELWANMRSEGLSFRVGGRRVDLLDSLTGYQKRLRRAVEDGVMQALRSEKTKGALTDGIAHALDEATGKLGARVTKVGFRGTDLLVTLERKEEAFPSRLNAPTP